jgi:hypothetical protein
MDDSKGLPGTGNIFKRILAWAAIIVSVVGALILGLFVGSKGRRPDGSADASAKDRVSNIEKTDGRIEGELGRIGETKRDLDAKLDGSQGIVEQSTDTIERAHKQLDDIESTESRIEKLLEQGTREERR